VTDIYDPPDRWTRNDRFEFDDLLRSFQSAFFYSLVSFIYIDIYILYANHPISSSLSLFSFLCLFHNIII
jgi:cellulose synthase/poly-beta-1,6-N-acetylglucosamine synthase-like glycosyltransferase